MIGQIPKLVPFGYIAPLSFHLQGKSDWYQPSSLWRLLIRIDFLQDVMKRLDTIGYSYLQAGAIQLHRPIVYGKSHWFWPSSLWRLLNRITACACTTMSCTLLQSYTFSLWRRHHLHRPVHVHKLVIQPDKQEKPYNQSSLFVECSHYHAITITILQKKKGR